MPGQLTQWYCQELLKASANRDTYTPAYTAFQLALTLDFPPLNADVTQLNEPPTGVGYARVAVPYNTANWTPSGFREITQALDINFPTATGYWGNLYGWALMTTEATPNMVALGNLVTPLRVITGIQPMIPAGSISLGLYD